MGIVRANEDQGKVGREVQSESDILRLDDLVLKNYCIVKINFNFKFIINFLINFIYYI